MGVLIRKEEEVKEGEEVEANLDRILAEEKSALQCELRLIKAKTKIKKKSYRIIIFMKVQKEEDSND